MAITPVSEPMFHDIVKALLHYKRTDAFEVCKYIPSLKNTSLLKNMYWVFYYSEEEYLTPTDVVKVKNRSRSKIDVIWFFRPRDARNHHGTFRVIHEIKTGKYDIDEIFHKYYSGMETQIWVWGWRDQNASAIPHDPKCAAKIHQGVIRKADIEYLVPLICPYLKEFYQSLDGDVWCARL